MLALPDTAPTVLIADSYFDGSRHYDDGPYSIYIAKGRIVDVVPGNGLENTTLRPATFPAEEFQSLSAAFVMPGLVEAHCHLFLDGGDLDFAHRSQYLKTGADEMMSIARANLQASANAGITLVRDAGDKYGINHAMRREAQAPSYAGPSVRSPGLALRKPKRYGAFMARAVADKAEIRTTMEEFAPVADDIKIIQTGIIDFEAGAVTEPPQFSAIELELIVEIARDHGRPTFAHCSGIVGIRLAVAAGVESIEHGFFIDRAALEAMADKGIAWVPTFAPVHFQWERPDLAGWSNEVVDQLRRILDDHMIHVALAHELGVPLICGSDAGSLGVQHGEALLAEARFFASAGVPMESVLAAASTLPRAHWSAESADIRADCIADIALFSASPFDSAANFEPNMVLGSLIGGVSMT